MPRLSVLICSLACKWPCWVYFVIILVSRLYGLFILVRVRVNCDQDKEAAKARGVDPPQAEAGVTPYIRPLTMADMRQAMEKVW